jgi:hypothetical protein
MPSSSACASFAHPSADSSTIRHRSTNRCGAVFARDKGSSSRLSLAVTVTVTDGVPTRSSSEDRDTLILTEPDCNQRPAISAEDI